MRVTFLAQWFEPEPPAVRGLPLARALVRRGFEVEVVTGFPNYPSGKIYPGYKLQKWQREIMSGIPVIRVPLYPSHDSNAIRRTANYASFAASSGFLGPLLAKRSDAIFAYHPPPTVGASAAVFRKVWGVPVIFHIADMYPESVVESGMIHGRLARKAVGSVLGTFCQWVYKHSDEITVLSPGFRTMLIDRGVDPGKVHVIYNWAHEEFQPQPRDPRLLAELGMAGRFNIVYAGNMGRMQGLESVLQAARLLRDLKDVQFVFVGGGTEETRLQEIARDLALTNVRFLGSRPIGEMPAINALADVLLVHLRDLPFFRSTIPGKTQVSLASGRPVLMGVGGDAADIITRAGAGLAVPPENPEALAGAARQLRALTSEAREQMGARGREYYLKEMGLEAGADRMAELLRGLGGRHRCP